MQYIQVDEWDLSSLSLEAIHDLRKENIPVCLQTEIVCGNEKVILMNIFAPRDQIFWNFADGYRAFSRGQSAFQNYLAGRQDWKEQLVEINELCNPTGNSFFSYHLLGGLTRGFNDVFNDYDCENINPALMDGFHCSIAMHAYMYESMRRYLELQLEYFGNNAFVKDFAGDLFSFGNEELYNNIFRMVISEKNINQPHARIPDFGKCNMNKAAFFHAKLRSPDFWPPSEKENIPLNLMSEILKARASWVISNLRLTSVAIAKNIINDRIWGFPKYADIRNELRRMFDTELARFPVIQTNPYENNIYDYPPV